LEAVAKNNATKRGCLQWRGAALFHSGTEIHFRYCVYQTCGSRKKVVSAEGIGQKGVASAGLTLDQYHQDQVVGVAYGESAGKRHAGLYVWDHADIALDELQARFEAAKRLPEPQRTTALAPFMSNGARRVFVGKNDDKSCEVTLFDQYGHPRLRMKVDSGGNPMLQFLDEQGRITDQFPAPSRRQ
jgi:hypothetical protein